MTDFIRYYKLYFQRDLLNFVGQIPIEGKKHYNKNELNIQYFFLTPQYKYLNIIPNERRGMFAVSLYWTVLIDQIFYTNFQYKYETFQRKTLYPKFIGNCTASSLMISACGHHQHPKRIFQALNDITDKGNRFDFDRTIFKNDESYDSRPNIDFNTPLQLSIEVMKNEIQSFFEKYEPEINWVDFWVKCEREL